MRGALYTVSWDNFGWGVEVFLRVGAIPAEMETPTISVSVKEIRNGCVPKARHTLPFHSTPTNTSISVHRALIRENVHLT